MPFSPVEQSHRWSHLQLGAPGLVELTPTHARFEDVQFGLAHRAFEAKQQAIVKAAWIIDAVLIENESRSQRAQFDQAMPVRRVTRQSRDLQAHDDASLTERYLAHELLEAVARGRARSGFAEVAINHMNALDRPTRSNRALAQRVLALRALAMFSDPTYADVVLDRLVHNAHRIDLNGESLRVSGDREQGFHRIVSNDFRAS